MKEKWLKYKKWRQDRFLKNWPRTRERGKLFFVIKTIFFWTLWMTFWMAMYDGYFSTRPANLIIGAIMNLIGGIIMGLGLWEGSEKNYQKLSAESKLQNLEAKE
jgi:hypothetical protein